MNVIAILVSCFLSFSLGWLACALLSANSRADERSGLNRPPQTDTMLDWMP